MQSRALPIFNMEQAERELEARIDYAFSKARQAEHMADELERRMGPPEPPTDEDVERIKAYVLGHARTEQWNQVIERINRGELTWRQVVEGLATGDLDRGVAAAFNSLSRVPPASLEKLIEIGVLPSEPVDAPDQAEERDEEPTPPRRRAPVEEEDEDMFFDNPLLRRR